VHTPKYRVKGGGVGGGEKIAHPGKHDTVLYSLAYIESVLLGLGYDKKEEREVVFCNGIGDIFMLPKRKEGGEKKKKKTVSTSYLDFVLPVQK